jgi:hypothetical protein
MCPAPLRSPHGRPDRDSMTFQDPARTMAKAPPKLRKTLSHANLALLGAERLAALLFAAAASDPALKRSLRLELAAEIGPGDLAQALDRRLEDLAASRARVSWRKRPELLRELSLLRTLIEDRLAASDGPMAFPRLVAWFDLLEPLQARTKDPRGELAELFSEAAGDLGRVAAAAGADVALPALIDALSTRSAIWSPFLGRAVGGLDPALAAALLGALTAKGVPKTGRMALVVRRLADRVGDLDVWMASFDEAAARQPQIRTETALRLARAGRSAEARAALDAVLSRPTGGRPGWRAPEPPPLQDDAWFDAEIAVLDAEGKGEAAMTARWARFERTLSAASLKDILSRLADFDDVVATDRALAFAASYFDLNRGLAFLMEFGALREAADMVTARHDELTGRADASALWASRLSGRFPAAALRLVRARARALVEMAGSLSADGAPELVDEAQALAATIPDAAGIEPHDAFLVDLRKALDRPPRRVRR